MVPSGMGKKLPKLTVKEKILIHLREHGRKETGGDVVFDITQEGIAEGVNIRLNHVPRAVKELIKKNYVSERTAHVRGTDRKRKAYFLTDEGLVKAQSIRSRVEESVVNFVDEKGKSGRMRISDVVKRFHGELALMDVVLAVSQDGLLDAENIGARKEMGKGGPGFVDFSDAAPEIDDFVGREEECKRIEDIIDNGGRRAVIIHGMRGIGKSSLVSKVLFGYKGKKNIFWYRFKEWDSLKGVLLSLSEFFDASGNKKLSKYLNKKEDVALNEMADMLGESLVDNTVLIFDNFYNIGPELEGLFSIMLDALRNRKESVLLVTTRDDSLLEKYHELVLREDIDDLVLDGLESKSAKKVFRMHKAPTKDFEMIYSLTKGHPLALELVASGRIDQLVDTEGLTPEESTMLKCLKAFDIVLKGN